MSQRLMQRCFACNHAPSTSTSTNISGTRQLIPSSYQFFHTTANPMCQPAFITQDKQTVCEPLQLFNARAAFRPRKAGPTREPGQPRRQGPTWMVPLGCLMSTSLCSFSSFPVVSGRSVFTHGQQLPTALLAVHGLTSTASSRQLKQLGSHVLAWEHEAPWSSQPQPHPCAHRQLVLHSQPATILHTKQAGDRYTRQHKARAVCGSSSPAKGSPHASQTRAPALS